MASNGKDKDRDKAKDKDDRSALEEVLDLVDRLPIVSTLKRDVGQLRRLLVDRRAPRVLAVGADGPARAALVSALVGVRALPATTGSGPLGHAPSGRWVRLDASGHRIDWLETEEVPERAGDPRRDVFGEALPDCVLFVCSATELGQTLDRDVERLRALVDGLARDHGQRTPIVAALVGVDALEPQAARPPYPDDKANAISLAEQTITQRLARHGLDRAKVVSVAAAGEERDRWNLEELAEALVESLPEAAQVEAARTFAAANKARRRVAKAIVHSCAAVALTVGLTPIPLSDAIVLLPLQGIMVSGIAYASGRRWESKTVAEWVASLGLMGGAGLGLRWTAQQIVKLLPGAGSLVSASIAAAGTAALGQSAIAYFLDAVPAKGTRRLAPQTARA